jgi:hypothetical protein
MSNPVVTGGSGEQSKTIVIKEEDLQALFHKMMGQTKQEVPTGPPVWFLHPGFYMLYNRASLTQPQISQHSLLSVAFSY